MNSLKLHDSQIAVLTQLHDKNNGLIIAKTGSGKSYIALALIHRSLDNCIRKKALVIAPTNILVQQHVETYSTLSNYTTSSVQSKYRKQPLKPSNLWTNGIYVCTGHYCKILISKQLINPEDFEIIIFDEAHKANSKTNCYSYIAESFKNHFRYGFTATSGSEIHQRKLLKNLKLDNVITGETPFSFTKTYKYVSLKNNKPYLEVEEMFQKWIQTSFLTITQLIKPPSRLLTSTYMLLPSNKKSLLNYCLSHNVSSFEFYRFFFLTHCKELLSMQSLRAFHKYRNNHRLKIPNFILNRISIIEAPPSKYTYICKKIHTKNGATLVFFENYESCLDFENYLIKFENVPVQSIAVLAGKSKLNKKNLNLQFEKCCSKNIEYILSTSVIEEGVNIREVDRVVFIKPITNIIRVIQREGRTGRYRNGQVYVLAYKNTPEQVNLKFMIARKKL